MSAPAPSDAPRFSIGPLGMAIEEGALRAWFAAARPGDNIVYASGVLPHKAATVVLVRELSAAGYLGTKQKRGQRGFDYIAERLTDPANEIESAESRAKADDAAGGGAATARVLRRLRLLAAECRPCDTNAELAKVCDLPNSVAASYQIRKLTARGDIAVQDGEPGWRRIVTICASGHRTGKARL